MISMFKTLLIKPILFIISFAFSIIYEFTGNKTIAILGILITFFFLILIAILGFIERKKEISFIKIRVLRSFENIGSQKGFFYLMLAYSVFFFFFIPSNTIQVSPTEFFTNHRTATSLLFNVFLAYTGLFLIWVNLIYYLSPKVFRGIETCLFSTNLICGMLYYYTYNTNNGIVSSLLIYEKKPLISSSSKLIGIIIYVVVFVFVYFLLSKNKSEHNSIIKNTGIILSAIFVAMSSTCILSIHNEIKKAHIEINQEKKEYEEILPISKDGKNVVVIMLDKAVSGYIPYIFADKPYLKEKFDGFTYYPNTLSYGGRTLYASPALYGGYEYTPLNVNNRKDETLADKHNEAITVLPLLFSENGFSSTVCDPPYAGFSHEIDLSIYDKYPGINAYRTAGVYKSNVESSSNTYYEDQQENALFWYSAYRSQIPVFRNIIYRDGTYNYQNSHGYFPQPFLDNVSVLAGLSELTDIKSDDSDNFIIIDNETTHEPVHLSIDECENYVLSIDFDYSNMDKILDGKKLHIYNETTYNFYVTDMISYIELGNWFDYLREQGVYDNTRIIIVSDHGVDEHQFDYMVFSNGIDMEKYNAVLMVKDYDTKGFTIDNEFMTVADVPTLATNEIIENPINPFTNKPITNDEKKGGDIVITTSTNENDVVGNYTVKQHNFKDGDLWRLSGENIYNETDWEKVTNP